ncbi:MAG: PucR family transcriptional regulator [Sporichthyaceae bacterium]
MGESAEAAALAVLTETVKDLLEVREELSAVVAEQLVAEIPELPREEDMLALMRAGVVESVAEGMLVLSEGRDPRSVPAPLAAAAYARRLAQRGVPVSVLLRAYRLGSSALIETMLAALSAHPGVDAAGTSAASVMLLRTITAYVDTVSELLVEAYEIERDAWSRQHSMARAARIQALLDGRSVEVETVERELGYRLRQTHLAALLWFEEGQPGVDLMTLERVAAAAAAVYGGEHLLLPTDEAGASLWLHLPEDVEDLAALAAVFSGRAGPTPRVALGSPGFGVAGFRRSHEQALAARRVAVLAGRHAAAVTTADEAGAVALLCEDLDATRAWVADTLGALAVDDENAARLRETVRVFLHLGSSHTAAAEELHLHKNTVQYRIAKAEAARGRPVRSDRADVELALRAAHLLGPVVLTPPS